MLENSWDWNEFFENLSDLQNTNIYTEITSGLKKVMYYFSLGILDFAVKLFIHVHSRTRINGGDHL